MSGDKQLTCHQLKVLIVEDNVVNQKVTSAMLKHFSIEADIAENGQVAMEMVQEYKYGIIFMDCQMPVMNGFDATRQIRQLTGGATSKDVPVLAMTANAAPEDMKKCFDSGMNDLIAKPVELETLAEKLKTWVNSSCVQVSAENGVATVKDDSSVLDDVFDMRVVKELQSLMGEDYKSVFDAFSNSLHEHMPNLQQAVSNGDATTIAGIAHTLKGSCANVGANKLSELCQQLMEKARVNDLTEADEFIAQIAEEYSKVDKALKQFL